MKDTLKPEDIINFRRKYNISQRELTSILDFGKMSINRYENNYPIQKSKSDHLKILINNEEEFIKKVKESYSNKKITEKTYNKIIYSNNINDIYIDYKNNIRKYINLSLTKKPDIYNGYNEFDLDKLENIISYISSKVNNLTITSLNKYLWFIDMLSFNLFNKSITGLTYQKQKYGPVIKNKIYDEITLLDDKYIKEDTMLNESIISNIKSKNNYDLSKVNNKEKHIIDEIINIFKDKKVSVISELSHKENAWLKTKLLDDISFEYASNLNINNIIKNNLIKNDNRYEELKEAEKEINDGNKYSMEEVFNYLKEI